MARTNLSSFAGSSTLFPGFTLVQEDMEAREGFPEQVSENELDTGYATQHPSGEGFLDFDVLGWHFRSKSTEQEMWWYP